jgi:hypothetical protein
MKKLNILILSTAILTNSFFAKALMADGGTREGFGAGNGGDTRAAVYLRRAFRIAQFLQNYDLIETSKREEILRRVVELRVEFFPESDMPCEGGRREACTNPEENLTKVSGVVWERISRSPQENVQLVSHELLRLVGLNDSLYMVSRDIARTYLSSRPLTLPPASGTYVLDEESILSVHPLMISLYKLVTQNGVEFKAYRYFGSLGGVHENGDGHWGRCRRSARRAAELRAQTFCQSQGGLNCVVLESSVERTQGHCHANAIAIDLAEHAW